MAINSMSWSRISQVEQSTWLPRRFNLKELDYLGIARRQMEYKDDCRNGDDKASQSKVGATRNDMLLSRKIETEWFTHIWSPD